MNYRKLLEGFSESNFIYDITTIELNLYLYNQNKKKNANYKLLGILIKYKFIFKVYNIDLVLLNVVIKQLNNQKNT